MNLLIYSPAARTSAIGRVTQLVVQALVAQGHESVVVRSEDTSHLDTPTHAFDAGIIRWDAGRPVAVLAQAADAVIYQIGNDYEFHRGCLEWLPRLPGIVCLHDFFLGNLFHGWSRWREPHAQAVLRAWYGEAVAGGYFSSCTSPEFVEETHQIAPMTEWVTSMANGVVTHSSWGIPRVLASCPGPVRVVPLPYDAPGLDLGASNDVPEAGADTFTLLTVGHMNPNKRIESVIRAIGKSDVLRSKTLYRLVGRIDPAVAQQFTVLAAGQKVRLAIDGEVDDATLRQAMRQADVVCCLRLPSLEAASASAIEAMLYGKAVVVMDTGFYSELPDAYVRKVSPDHEIDDLKRELEALCMDRAERSALGTNAAEWAAATFSAANYAESLTQMCAKVAEASPSIQAGRYFGQTLARWGASAAGVPVSDTIAPLRIFQDGLFDGCVGTEGEGKVLARQ